MGKFFKYETAMARRFSIDTTTSKITRPDRPISHGDLFGAIVDVGTEECTVIALQEDATALTAYIVVEGTPTALVYTKATDLFTLGETALTNVFIDSFGKVKAGN